MLGGFTINGTWCAGSNAGVRGVVEDFRAGLLVTFSGDRETSGAPSDFRADDGLSGLEVLLRILIPPTCRDFKYGAIRESLASVRSVALFGFAETRAWDGPTDYVVDTGEGSLAVARFVDGNCFAAMVSIDPSRPFSVEAALIDAPIAARRHAASVLGLPLLAGRHTAAVTAVFWSEGDRLASNEDWPTVFKFGAEIFRHELLPDHIWAPAAVAHYELTSNQAHEIARLARSRLTFHAPIPIEHRLFDVLVPPGSPYQADALSLLLLLGFMRDDT
jgi:hypothetical protein